MDELEKLVEIEHGRPTRRPATPSDTPFHTPDEFAVVEFEQWQNSISELPEPEPIPGDPTPLQLQVLHLLPNNLRILEIGQRLGVSYWFSTAALKQLESLGLVTRCANRRHWPTVKGFALIGIPPVPAPRHPNLKAGQSIYFGKGNPTPPKPKASLPSKINITETNEGYFINVNGATLDVPFDSAELAQRGAEAWLSVKPSRKGLADYFKRKKAALFQFMGEA